MSCSSHCRIALIAFESSKTKAHSNRRNSAPGHNCCCSRARRIFWSSCRRTQSEVLNSYISASLEYYKPYDDRLRLCSPASSGSSPAINDDNGTHGTDVRNSSTTKPLENIADALNGTSFASISYDSTGKYNGDSAQQNYVLFYQCSNGNIRKKYTMEPNGILPKSLQMMHDLVQALARYGLGIPLY